MNKRKLNKAFQEVQEKAHMDYAITNVDDWGDCNTCVNSALGDKFGIDSKGIYAKHWRKGMNAGCPWKDLDKLYIGHDISDEQAYIMIKIFEENGYDVEPKEYNCAQCFVIQEKEVK